jgi:hypothetical protein
MEKRRRRRELQRERVAFVETIRERARHPADETAESANAINRETR